MLSEQALQEIAEHKWRLLFLDKPLGGWTLVLAMQVGHAAQATARQEAFDEAIKVCELTGRMAALDGKPDNIAMLCAEAISQLKEST